MQIYTTQVLNAEQMAAVVAGVAQMGLRMAACCNGGYHEAADVEIEAHEQFRVTTEDALFKFELVGNPLFYFLLDNLNVLSKEVGHKIINNVPEYCINVPVHGNWRVTYFNRLMGRQISMVDYVDEETADHLVSFWGNPNDPLHYMERVTKEAMVEVA